MKVKEANPLYQRLLKQPDCAFDGHTCFSTLTPDQRLIWLGQAAYFVFMTKGRANKVQTRK